MIHELRQKRDRTAARLLPRLQADFVSESDLWQEWIESVVTCPAGSADTVAQVLARYGCTMRTKAILRTFYSQAMDVADAERRELLARMAAR